MVAVGVLAGLALTPALAQGATPQAPTARFERQLSFDAHFAEGEPSIAVNPRNPKNVIVTFLVNTGFGSYGLQNNTAPVARDITAPIQACDYVMTIDGGATWKRGTLP